MSSEHKSNNSCLTSRMFNFAARLFSRRMAASQPLSRRLLNRCRAFTSASAFVTGGVLFMSTATAAAVWCRPLDTPDYLLPYYLRDTRSRFTHYASIRKKSGARFMTAEDFVCSLLATKETKLEDSKAVDDLAALFAATDANGDGKLSYSEYSFLMLLLTTKPKDFELSFTVFDEDAKGSLALPQFIRVITALSDDDGAAVRKLAGGGILKKLFGETGMRRCTYAEFSTVVDQLQQEVWKAEFLQFDSKRRGFITAEQFGQLISGQMLGSHLPFYIVENLRNMKSQENGTVPFSSWIAFHKIMSRAEEIGEAIELYTASGASLRKKDFSHAITALGLPPLSPAEVNLVFGIFDKNGDGTLEYDEFLSIMREKISFHARPRPREKKNVFVQIAQCTSELL